MTPVQHTLQAAMEMKMATAKTTYAVARYTDGVVMGHVDLTDEQFTDYMAQAQQPEGVIRLGAMPRNLDDEYQDAGPDTVVFLD